MGDFMAALSQQLFKDNLNGEFKVDLEKNCSLVLQLTQVSAKKDQGPYESYTVEFTGPKEAPLNQGMYDLSNKSLGKHTIFLVPVGERKEGIEYEAVFSYKKES
jgi:hypothetical protein